MNKKKMVMWNFTNILSFFFSPRCSEVKRPRVDFLLMGIIQFVWLFTWLMKINSRPRHIFPPPPVYFLHCCVGNMRTCFDYKLFLLVLKMKGGMKKHWADGHLAAPPGSCDNAELSLFKLDHPLQQTLNPPLDLWTFHWVMTVHELRSNFPWSSEQCVLVALFLRLVKAGLTERPRAK